MPKYPSETADRFLCRLPNGWRDAIRDEATRNHRSMNAEVTACLETAFRVKGIALPEASAEK